MTNAAAVLRRWHAAVNAGEVESATELCRPDVAVRGPRGVGHGRDLVSAWLVRSGIRLDPQEDLVERDGRVVVRETARWTAATAADGAPAEPATTWCVFIVTDGLVSSIARYDAEADIPPVGQPD